MTQKPNKTTLLLSLPSPSVFPVLTAVEAKALGSFIFDQAFLPIIFFIFSFAFESFGLLSVSKVYGQTEDSARNAAPNTGTLISLPSPGGPLKSAVETFAPQQSSSLPSASLPASLDPNQLVLRAVQQAVWGPSVHCRMQQTSGAGELSLIGEGEYWSAGQGSGQLKMTMQLAAGELQTNMIQVSDGRLVWTSTSDDEVPRRVYLDRIRSALGNMSRNPTEYPQAALYLAIGGQAEMLRCLYFRYRWFRVIAGKDDQDVPVWQLIGTLRTETPSVASVTIADSYFIQPQPVAELPTDVRLILDRDGKLPLFPRKVEYFRREASTNDSPGKLELVSTIAYTEITSPITITKELFQYQVREDADRIEDETNDYLPSVPIADAGTLQRR